MCGIVGFFEKKKEADLSILEMMVKMQEHRGPDDSGLEIFSLFSDKTDFAMGFDRLSIIDTSMNGHQPMKNEDGSVIITFNGEIYNAFSYRNELEARGHKFISKTDTEILLHLYEDFGIDGMLNRINGMFSICIADLRKREMYLIRDRFGVKPLYYYQNEDVFLYASEYKTFYAHPQFENELNIEKLPESIMFRYIAGRDTLLKGVYNVLPAHYLKISSDLSIQETEYWNLDEKKKIKSQGLKGQDYDKILECAVSDRLVSDVGLGVQLSGGIDSSLVLHYAARNKKDLNTFSIIFDSEKYSEKPWIDEAAKKTIDITQNQYKFEIKEFGDLLEKATWHSDSPLNHPNSIGIYLLCKEAKQKVTVLMTGEGADEVFGGYSRYSRGIWHYKHPKLSFLMGKIHNKNLSNKENFIDKSILSSAFVNEKVIKRILTDSNSIDPTEIRKEIFKSCKGKDCTERWLNYELKTYLVDILNRQDKMSMAAGVETRVPFLDYRLVEAVRSQDIKTYVSGSLMHIERYTKKPLKRIAVKIYGKRFTYRRKLGFPMPMRACLSTESISAYIEEEIMPVLSKSGLFNMEEILKIWSNKNSVDNKQIELLWVLIAHGVWMKLFLGDKKKVQEYGR